jgi:phosphoribosylglycinamide formyltransferase-1
MKYKLGFLASHNGSNMQAIIDACKNGQLDMVPTIVISNNLQSGALERAKLENIPFYHLNSTTHPDELDLDNAIKDKLIQHEVDLVILAGYMKKVGEEMLSYYENRIINIHPALLPKYGGQGMYGLRVHEAVIDNQETETGITIHLVDKHYDNGRILNQVKIPVYANETAQELQQRVLKYEHSFFVETLIKIGSEEIKLD